VDGFGHQRLDLSCFTMQMRDRITGWPPVNLSRAALYGGELAWEWNPWSILSSVRTAVSVTRARSLDGASEGSQLPYVPLIQGSVSVERRVASVEFFLQTRFASRQYTTLDNIVPLSSDPYGVVDCSVACHLSPFGVESRAQLVVENLLSDDYEIVRGYPMPLRSYRVNISVHLH
jgi:vitamin B12 transporter